MRQVMGDLLWRRVYEARGSADSHVPPMLATTLETLLREANVPEPTEETTVPPISDPNDPHYDRPYPGERENPDIGDLLGLLMPAYIFLNTFVNQEDALVNGFDVEAWCKDVETLPGFDVPK